MDDRQDHERMLAVRDGHLDSLAAIFERHHVRLYNFFLKMTGDPHASEDLVQDTFHRILKSRHTYRDDSRFTTWMFAVARSACLTHWRKNKHTKDLVQLDEVIKDRRPGPAERLEKQQEIGRIRRALSGLSEEKREAIVLSRFEDMNYEQISEIAGCAVGTIKARVHRALKDLSRIYEEMGNDVQRLSEASD